MRLIIDNSYRRRHSAPRKPKQCPKCGGPRVALIKFGVPTPHLLAFARAGHIALGGCGDAAEDARWECLDCSTKVWLG